MNSIKGLIWYGTFLFFSRRRVILGDEKVNPERCLSGGTKPHRLVYDFCSWPPSSEQLTVYSPNRFVIIRSEVICEFVIKACHFFRKSDSTHNVLLASSYHKAKAARIGRIKCYFPPLRQNWQRPSECGRTP